MFNTPAHSIDQNRSKNHCNRNHWIVLRTHKYPSVLYIFLPRNLKLKGLKGQDEVKLGFNV